MTKKMMLLTALVSLVEFAANADCVDLYVARIQSLNAQIVAATPRDQLRYDRQNALSTTGAVGGGSGSVLLAESIPWIAANGGTALVSTAAAPIFFGGIMAGLYTTNEIGKRLYPDLNDIEVPKLDAQVHDAKQPLDLIKQAELGDGQLVQALLTEFIEKDGQKNLSESQLADKIVQMNNANVFCQNGTLDNLQTLSQKVLGEIQR